MPCEPLGPDRVSLLQLHALVPAAEELDLADEVRHEQLVAGLVPREDLDGVDRRVRRKADDHEASGQESAEAEDGEEPDPAAGEPLSEGQVRGLLEHQLGATPLPDDPDDPDGRSDQPGRPDQD